LCLLRGFLDGLSLAASTLSLRAFRINPDRLCFLCHEFILEEVRRFNDYWSGVSFDHLIRPGESVELVISVSILDSDVFTLDIAEFTERFREYLT
jgi:hypothetical protein